MNSMFRVISDTRFEFIEVELRNELRNLIMKAGRKKIVFVEGYDDKAIFDILYGSDLDKLDFIDTSMEEAKQLQIISRSCGPAKGGCEAVKNLLKKFVSHLRYEKRFYGVIDRDLRKDEDVEFEKSRSCYDGRLFVFFERYTLENYFIEIDILCKFLHGKSINNKKLLPLLSDEEQFKKDITDIVDNILDCLTEIGAANLTIRSFDNSISFIEDTIKCDEVEHRLVFHRLDRFPEDDVKRKFNSLKDFIRKTDSTQKFANVKTYFSCQFNRHLERKTGVGVQLNNHKSELARILKEHGLPDDFKALSDFLLKN